MAKRWFRVHADGPASILDNDKIQALPAPLFKWLINLWAFACRNEAVLPPLEKIARKLHKSPATVQSAVSSLLQKRFIEEIDGCLVIHDWSDHQFESDSSTERVRKFRERQRNVSVTPRASARSESESVSDSVGEGERKSETIGDGGEMKNSWRHDETYTLLVGLYRKSGKPLIDEDFEDGYWPWSILDWDHKKLRIDRLQWNLDNGVYDDPSFIPKPKNFILREYKRELRSKTSMSDHKNAVR